MVNRKTFAGLINRKTDADFVRFTAATTGTITLSANTSRDLSLRWTVGSQTFTGNSITLNVTAGTSYTVGLSSTTGIGSYTVTGSYTGNNTGGGKHRWWKYWQQ